MRWIKGEASRREQMAWERWEHQDPLHKELKAQAKALQDLPMEVATGSDVEDQLDKLHKRLDKSKQTFNYTRKTKSRSPGYHWGAVAAAVLLLIIGGIAVMYHSMQSGENDSSKPLYTNIEAGYGEQASLDISDGSAITLNANSRLRYSPEQFNRPKVEVWLEGEAFFDITRKLHDNKRTFIVHTSDGDIQVLGTRFNVNTRFESTKVVLEEGSVDITLPDDENQRHLQPGQLAEFKKSGAKIHVQDVNTSLYTSWLDGKLTFDDTSLQEIIQNIEATYNVSIEVGDPSLLNNQLSGSLQNPDLSTLIEGLNQTLNLRIERKSEEVYELKGVK